MSESVRSWLLHGSLGAIGGSIAFPLWEIEPVSAALAFLSILVFSVTLGIELDR